MYSFKNLPGKAGKTLNNVTERQVIIAGRSDKIFISARKTQIREIWNAVLFNDIIL